MINQKNTHRQCNAINTLPDDLQDEWTAPLTFRVASLICTVVPHPMLMWGAATKDSWRSNNRRVSCVPSKRPVAYQTCWSHISVALKYWLFVECHQHLMIIVIWRTIKLGIAALWHQILAHVLLDGDDGRRMPLWCNEHRPVKDRNWWMNDRS